MKLFLLFLIGFASALYDKHSDLEDDDHHHSELGDDHPHTIDLQSGHRYILHWTVDRGKKFITFEVSVKTTGWVGFGISPFGGMTKADIAIGWVRDGKVWFQVNDVIKRQF